MEPKTQDFDSNRGGTHRVEPLLNIREFCKNRIDEILMLTESLNESPFRGQAFQRLPKHMRRRQMSHHIKRLPRSIRKSYIGSPKDDVISQSKRPSRKYRRRPQNLLKEYNRRQKTNIWLETHIWHAKRFHMISKWGYKLPDKPTNKSFRACYRAARKHCLLNDISFYNCIELKGFEEKILEGLQKCVSPDVGLTFASKMFIKGYREGRVMLFHPDCYPYRAIGEVSFLWKPFKEEEEKFRTLWIFTHPLCYQEIVEMFKDLFNLNESLLGIIQLEMKDIKEKEESTTHLKSLNESDKLEKKNIPCKENVKFFNEDETFSMVLLKDEINRFRLTGPLSLSIIANAFDIKIPVKPPRPRLESVKEKGNENEIEIEIETEREWNETERNKRRHSEVFESCSGNSPAKKIKTENENNAEIIVLENEWWYKYYENEFNKNCFDNQKKFYDKLKNYFSPLDLPSGMVFSVVVKDPRLTLPNKRIKSVPEIDFFNGESPPLLTIDDSLSSSPLWDSNVRDEVSFMKISTAKINSFRSNLIIPGSDVGKFLEEDNQAKIPLIIIQSPPSSSSSCTTGFGCGFDVLVPAGWAMPVWLSLIYRGARTGGLRESEALIAQSGNLTGFFQPDSLSGEKENLENFKYLKMHHFKHPPNKRPNFTKIGVESPFYFPWEILIKEWRDRSAPERSEPRGKFEFFVLRNRKTLSDLNDLLRNLSKMLSGKKKKFDFNVDFKEEELECLVPVSVESLDKGTPKQHAMICIPNEEDVKSRSCPVEPSHSDENDKIRKNLKLEHSKMLKSLKRKRRKEKMKNNKKESEREESEISSKEIVHKYKEKSESLWLKEPENINSLIDTCSRTVLGFIILGGFNYVKGQGLGSGYVTLRGLLNFLNNCYKQFLYPLVLFRNSNSINYKFANLSISMD